MTSLLSKQQIYMEGGYMQDNMLLQVLILMGGLFSMLLSFYMLLLFIQWVSDVIDEKRWEVWREWIR